MEVNMALKKTSKEIQVSFLITEAAANTFTQDQHDLALDPLNNEVFVVQAIDFNADPPDVVGGTDTRTTVSLSSSTRTTLGTLANSNVMASVTDSIQDGIVGFSTENPSAVTSGMVDSIGIIATSNFFVQIEGGNNAQAKTASGRIYGYRAKADSGTYAALVQSEVLSA